MSRKIEGPLWFKFPSTISSLINALPPEKVGEGVQAALVYHMTGEVDLDRDTNPLAYSVFAFLKEFIDEAHEDYDIRVSNGKKGGRPPKVTKTDQNQHLAPETEVDAEVDTEVDTEVDAVVDADVDAEVDADVDADVDAEVDADAYVETAVDAAAVAETVVAHLNAKTGSSFKVTPKVQDLISDHLANGYNQDDFIAMINGMVAAWGQSDKMRTYLRPSTLFGDKFDEYLNVSTKSSDSGSFDTDEFFNDALKHSFGDELGDELQDTREHS